MNGSIPARVLVIMAHPNDADYFAGGTVATWAAAGADIVYLLLTRGDRGSDDPSMTPERVAALRREEQQSAARVLGVSRVIFWDEPDGELAPTLDLRRRLVAEIRRHRPDAVMASDPTRYYFGDSYVNHPDHRAAGEATLAAVSPAARNPLYHPELLADGLEPHVVRELWLFGPLEPNRWMDVGALFHLKVAAMPVPTNQADGRDRIEKQMRAMNGITDEEGNIAYREGFRYLLIG